MSQHRDAQGILNTRKQSPFMMLVAELASKLTDICALGRAKLDTLASSLR
jgi:hypothetical protein